ncbi:MAG TPA: RdgB/HAM1 family non-canonical purine NTP pyrophosphatase [Dehalococcoidia bacterium]|nr:RdgB/HAM1 family non-canonical purine NTP pyrophosphatase [Dehalococcoidia bacterium]
MPEIVVATNNAGKVVEFRELLGESGLTVITPGDLGYEFEVDETGRTYVENARLKAREALRLTGLPSLGDDSGIEVDALDGAPGLRSARYAGEGANDRDNRELLLSQLDGVNERSARFRCLLVLAFTAADEHVFEGVCEGEIARREAGDLGFGYDPIFVPEGYEQTMAELAPKVKNRISHRGRAVAAALPALRSLA